MPVFLSGIHVIHEKFGNGKLWNAFSALPLQS